MRKIDVKLLKYDSLNLLTQLACVTTRGANKFSSADEILRNIQDNPWSNEKIFEMLSLPHSKIARFTDFIFVIAGASRRFLAQLTTHHIGISIMSGSLQYSDHSVKHLDDMFVVPYELIDTPSEDGYLKAQKRAMDAYNVIAKVASNDTAGYSAPHSLRNVLLVKVNLEEMRFIANQRLCKRNTDETRYIVARMVEEIVNNCSLPHAWFMPSCYKGSCKEKKYTCGKPITDLQSLNGGKSTEYTIYNYLNDEFSKIRKLENR